MSFSQDALLAFVAAVDNGSISAAARQLGKRQSTLSESIANLEIDLALTLFERGSRQLSLTVAGQRLLPLARQALAAHDSLQLQAAALASGVEARLTLVLSDTFHTGSVEPALKAFASLYPYTELECLVGEQDDLLALVRSGRAQLGLMPGEVPGGSEFAVRELPQQARTSLYVAPDHPLAQQPPAGAWALQAHRQLRLQTFSNTLPADGITGRCWYAPSYLLLLEMTQLGFGWAELPDWLVARYAPELVPLALPGWPQQRSLHAVWQRAQPLGPAAAWMLQQFLQPAAAGQPGGQG
ncbi:LysR family transcriptional regulator [Vogesella mureinivorans]|uniref:LysR family transcriptional regulator n=1 Tax=Vogesella mureinivorans TaxID=657276 RepID=UPI0011CAD5F9|nr:LysR family transcriptional regulator [Vogesella mureinivorans]